METLGKIDIRGIFNSVGEKPMWFHSELAKRGVALSKNAIYVWMRRRSASIKNVAHVLDIIREEKGIVISLSDFIIRSKKTPTLKKHTK